jgi:uncharacterized membrane protein (UPF0127 family)
MWERRLERLPERHVAGIAVRVADTPLARLAGLALLDEPPPGTALLIPRCRSVHTFGMRFALDLVWLDEHERPIRVDRARGPGLVIGEARAAAVIELVSRPDDLLEPHAQRAQGQILGDVQLQ